jgi:hypothetical protein
MDTRCRLTRQTGHLSRIGILALCKEQIAAKLITIPKTNSGAAHIKAIEFHDQKVTIRNFFITRTALCVTPSRCARARRAADAWQTTSRTEQA